MRTSDLANNESGRKFALTHITKGLADLFDCVITDAVTDIEVAARDLQISDDSFVPLRRALDRLTCAQAVLAAMSAGSMGASDDEWALRMQMREAVDLLARGGRKIIWPGR